MSTKKSTKAASKKRNKSNNNSKSVKNDSNLRSTVSTGSTAASYEVSLRNPTKFEIQSGKSPRHAEYGIGIRVLGRQQFTLVTTTNANSNLFTAGVATVTANYGALAPIYMSDRIAQLSAMYQRYVFRKILFTYVTRVATTQAGSMVMAYNSDSGSVVTSTSVVPTYATCQDISPSVIFAFRKERETLEMIYTGERTWMVALDSNANATPEAVRQCTQGLLQGFPDITSIGNINMGEIYIDYILDLYAPSNINTNVGLVLDSETRRILEIIWKKFGSLSISDKQLQVCKINTLLHSFI